MAGHSWLPFVSFSTSARDWHLLVYTICRPFNFRLEVDNHNLSYEMGIIFYCLSQIPIFIACNSC